MTLVVDASVGLKWFSEEEGSDAARAILASDERLVAPDLIVPEVCNAALKAFRLGMMLAAQLDGLGAKLAASLQEVYPTGPLARHATSIARSLNHPVYDCFYIALSEENDCAVVSADKRLARLVQTTPWERRVKSIQEVALSIRQSRA